MAETVAEQLLKRFNKVKSDRVTYENVWQEIADLVLPNQGDFTTQKSPGQKSSKNVYDTTAGDSNKLLASTILGGMISPGVKWANLGLKGMPAKTDSGRTFLDIASDAILDVLSGPESHFISQAHEFLLSVGAFGTACMFVEEDNEDGEIKFCTIHLAEIFVLEDKYGHIDTVFRKFKFSARQAAQMWGEKVHPKMMECLTKEPDKKFELLHIVMPRDDVRGVGKNKLPYASYYLDVENKHIITEGGFHEMPYIISRFYKLTGETYGRSPAWDALPNIKMLNVLQRDIIKTINFQATPPMLVADDGVMMPLEIKPFGVVVGGLSLDGTARVQPLQLGTNPAQIFDLIQAKQGQVKQSYFVDSLTPKAGTPITATEAAQQHESFLRLMTPQMSRFQEEFLEPIIERVFGLLLRKGILGDIPEELQGKKMEVTYLGPLAKLQKQHDLAAAQKYFASIAPLAQLMPEVLDAIHPDRFAARMADLSGLSHQVFRTQKEIDDIRSERQKAMQAQQNMQMAQTAGDVIGKLPIKPQ